MTKQNLKYSTFSQFKTFFKTTGSWLLGIPLPFPNNFLTFWHWRQQTYFSVLLEFIRKKISIKIYR